ncbi:MAG: L,D-transpeptidase family protein [Rhizobiales bacterium]|nr:L,D-transpeptidase family protein [Hyphomicrobiales bacterium]
MRLRSTVLFCALLGVGFSGPSRAEGVETFRLADWEVEAAIPRPPLDTVGPLTAADFGLPAFPPSPLIVEHSHTDPAIAGVPLADDEHPDTALAPAPVIPEPSAAELAAIPDDPPSLVENGQPDPALTVRRVAQALQSLLTKAGPERAAQQAFATFYAERRYEPLFVQDGVLSARGQAVLTRLGQAGDDGLDPTAFRIALPEGTRNAESVARLEIALARAVALYAAQASGGRTDPAKLSGYFDVHPPRIETAQALGDLAKATDATAAVEAFNPPHEGFRRLRAKLIEMRGERREMTDTPVVRRTVLRERDVVANLERWRWLPRDLGQAHIWVNSPTYTVQVVQDGRTIHQTRAVMGRAETQTPIFSDAMSHIVFNPYWHVPHSIVRRSMLSGAARNGGYFARRGIQVVQGGRVVDASTINWGAANIGRYAFRQPPGAANALGKMKFMFPNRHAIYLHDTPSRQYFGQSYRALSNGCVRVQNPEALAEVLLNLGLPGETWTAARIQGLYGANERTVRFRQAVPIHLVYFTMTVDSSGALVEYDDIYGHNARVRAVLASARG